MSKSSSVKKELTKALHLAAKALKLKDYKINLNFDLSIGDGFLSSLYKASLIDNITKEEIQLAVKRSPRATEMRAKTAIEFCYKNEIQFYTKIYPALQNLEKKYNVSQFLNIAPQYVTSISDLNEEIIVLKNILPDGFQLRDKQLLFDDEHARLIFETYGHFHAVSFCLKKQEPEKFHKLVQPLTRIWNKMNAGGKGLVISSVQQSYDALNKTEDAAIKKKFEDYVLNCQQKFENATHYHGKYSGILHGDCWSNNMMFKYKDYQNQKHLQGINLIDFQVLLTGTPVTDLSYFFYSGCQQELFDSLEQYLDVYYKSFTRAASNLGENSGDLFPREALSEDFQQYAKLGMMLSLFMIKIKLISKKEALQLKNNLIKKKPELSRGIIGDPTMFQERAKAIIRHLHKINAL